MSQKTNKKLYVLFWCKRKGPFTLTEPERDVALKRILTTFNLLFILVDDKDNFRFRIREHSLWT